MAKPNKRSGCFYAAIDPSTQPIQLENLDCVCLLQTVGNPRGVCKYNQWVEMLLVLCLPACCLWGDIDTVRWQTSETREKNEEALSDCTALMESLVFTSELTLLPPEHGWEAEGLLLFTEYLWSARHTYVLLNFPSFFVRSALFPSVTGKGITFQRRWEACPV